MLKLAKKYNSIIAEVEECRVKRNEVVEKKLTDPDFVSHMCSLIVDVLAKRDSVKKKFVKHRLRLDQIS